MRIATWNMNHCMRSRQKRLEAWEYIQKELRADLVLVQEAVPPKALKSVYRPLFEDRSRYNWGSAVVSLNPDVALRARPRVPMVDWDFGEKPGDSLPDSHPGATAVADVLDRAGRFLFTAVSFYGQWETMANGRQIYSCAKVHRLLSDLTGVLAMARRRPVVLAGDFNLTTQIAYFGQTQEETDGAAAAFARVRAWGLRECVAETHSTRAPLSGCTCTDEACAHVQTFRLRNRADSRPTQLDYAFVSESLLPVLEECRVVDDAAAWALSDHCPILLSIETGIPRVRRTE